MRRGARFVCIMEWGKRAWWVVNSLHLAVFSASAFGFGACCFSSSSSVYFA